MFEKESHNQDTKISFYDGCTDHGDIIFYLQTKNVRTKTCKDQCQQHWDPTTSKELGNDSSHVQPLKLCEAIHAGKLTIRQAQGRRLEVVADGLPLFHGAQLAIDTTLVSPVRSDGAPRRQCATRDGAALDQARRTKERRYPELTG